MKVHQDFRELLELFNERRIDYVIVGGFALAFHGAPRYTGDIDLYVHPTPTNAKGVLEALVAFGFGSAGLSVEDFTKTGHTVQLGFPPVRIDIVTSVDGVSWEQVQDTKVFGDCGGVEVPYIGRDALIANKQASGRKKDVADLEALGEEK